MYGRAWIGEDGGTTENSVPLHCTPQQGREGGGWEEFAQKKIQSPLNIFHKGIVLTHPDSLPRH